jgi:hypothetical protein
MWCPACPRAFIDDSHCCALSVSPLVAYAARGGGPLGVARADSFTVMSSPDVAAARAAAAAAAGGGAGPSSAAGEAPGPGVPSPYVS